MNKTVIWVVIIAVVLVGGFMLFNKSSGDGGAVDDVQLTGETKKFDITAKNWEFSPAVIEVNLGDRVELHLESIEGTHGFTISEFGVSESLSPGEDIHVDFVADKTGIFNFYCHIPCGQGHGAMRGQLVVR